MPESLLPFKNLIGLSFALTLPLGLFWLARLVGMGWARDFHLAGRIGLSLLLFMTASAHFTATDRMALMLPPFVPAPEEFVYATGVLEIVLALALHLRRWTQRIGIIIAIMLVFFLPANIHAAMHGLPFGGNVLGPEYLFLRVPWQFLLIFWTLWAARVWPRRA